MSRIYILIFMVRNRYIFIIVIVIYHINVLIFLSKLVLKASLRCNVRLNPKILVYKNIYEFSIPIQEANMQ